MSASSSSKVGLLKYVVVKSGKCLFLISILLIWRPPRALNGEGQPARGVDDTFIFREGATLRGGYLNESSQR